MGSRTDVQRVNCKRLGTHIPIIQLSLYFSIIYPQIQEQQRLFYPAVHIFSLFYEIFLSSGAFKLIYCRYEVINTSLYAQPKARQCTQPQIVFANSSGQLSKRQGWTGGKGEMLVHRGSQLQDTTG